MNKQDWESLLIDRGSMTKTEAEEFGVNSSAYFRPPHSDRLDKSDIPPFFGRPALQYHGRKRQYLAFKHASIVDLVYAISASTPEIMPWSADVFVKDHIVISQPHNGVFFANVWGHLPLGNYSSSFLKMLSGHTEVFSIYSSSNDDPCSYQVWRDGKCMRAIEWIPHPQTHGSLVDIGQPQSHDPTYQERPWYDDVNRALETLGYAGHRIPPLKSKSEGVFAWKVRLPKF